MRRALAVLLALGLFVTAESARAQEGGGSGAGQGGAGSSPNSGPSGGFPSGAESSPESLENPPSESPRSVKLFDQKRVTQSFELDIGPVWYREARRGSVADYARGTGELLVGVAISTTWKPFYLTGLQQTNIRAFEADSVAWSILTHQFAAGVHLGPLEPEVRVGFSLLTLDVFKGNYSIEALTPRVGVGVGMHVGKIRLDIQAHSEYLWRWFGPDYEIRGVSVGLRLDVPRPKPVFTDTPRR